MKNYSSTGDIELRENGKCFKFMHRCFTVRGGIWHLYVKTGDVWTYKGQVFIPNYTKYPVMWEIAETFLLNF